MHDKIKRCEMDIARAS